MSLEGWKEGGGGGSERGRRQVDRGAVRRNAKEKGGGKKKLKLQPESVVKFLDGFSVQIVDGLLVLARHAVLGAGVAVERVNGFGNAHL